MRKSIVVLIVAVLAVAAGAVVLSLSAPVLDEEVEYRLTSLYYRGQEISSQVDGDEVLDLLDELRNQLPVELKRAQELLAAREKFVDEAKRDVERMMRQADLEAKSKVSDSEVLYAAKEKARKIIADAEDRSRQLCQVANEYAEDALARTEEAVQAALTEVKQSRSAFRAASAAKLQEQREKLDAEKKNAEQPES